jgi:hypothetical protein
MGAIPYGAGSQQSKGKEVSLRWLVTRAIKYSPHIVFLFGFASGVADNINYDIYNPIKSGTTVWNVMTAERSKPEQPVVVGWGEKTLDVGLTVVGGFYKAVGFVGAFTGDVVASVFHGGYNVYQKLSPPQNTDAPPAPTLNPLPNSTPQSSPQKQSAPSHGVDDKINHSPSDPNSSSAVVRKSYVKLEGVPLSPVATYELKPSRTMVHYNVTKPKDLAVA